MTKTFARLTSLVCVLSALFPLLVGACAALHYDRPLSSLLATLSPLLALYCAGALACGALAPRAFAWLETGSAAREALFSRLAPRQAALAVFTFAALGILLELILVRWQATVFQLFSYYKNFGLFACFAGLGIGYAAAGRRSLSPAISVALLALQLALFTVSFHGLGWPVSVLFATPVVEYRGMGLEVAESKVQFVAIYALLLLTFLTSAAALLPVGQACGRMMARLPKLRAYGLNLAGSLFGVGLCFGLSALWSPPAVWFGIAFATLVALTAVLDRRAMPVSAAVAVLGLATLILPNASFDLVYSPYQLIERVPGRQGETATLLSGGTFLQSILDLSASNPAARVFPYLRESRQYYDAPYKGLSRLDRVAVVGAGTGNDVAAALRAGARRVDAIEIDPVIVDLGRKLHPEHPYDDPRVTVITEDARTFLRNANETYDLIVFGFLDSHGLVGTSATIRMDSFVYTVEAMREARARLRPGGTLSVSFGAVAGTTSKKLFLILKTAFDGRAPRAFDLGAGGFVFLIGRDGSHAPPIAPLAFGPRSYDATEQLSQPALDVEASTDDWPFLLMPTRKYPVSYLLMMLLALGLTAALTRAFLGRSSTVAHSQFFVLGAGFMLVEAKALTELGLLFGNNRKVVGVTIAGILVMALAANGVVAARRRRGARGFFDPRIVLTLLVLSILLGYAITGHGGFPSTIAGRYFGSFVLTLPVFFSGILFSLELEGAELASQALAANILGAILGGALEYNCLYFGLHFLYLLAIGLYALLAPRYFLR